MELGPVNFRSFIHRLLQAAINFNEAEFLEILTQLIETLGFEQTIVEICYPYLKKLVYYGIRIMSSRRRNTSQVILFKTG